MVAPTPYPIDVEAVLSKLTIQQKVALLGGKNFMHLAEIPQMGIEACRCSDGPNGVRGEWVFNSLGSSVFPSAIGLASTFDTALVREIAEAIGEECREKGVHVHLGPTVNMVRSPLGGRGFECYSEDPLLSGAMGTAFIQGIQSKGVASCLKHFVANDQEYERWSIDAVVPERALREIYLEPFRLILRDAQPQSVMSAYNSVNGTHVSENKALMVDILRKEWRYDGCVISDWTGVYSTLGSLRAGVDVEMPGPPVMRGDQTLRLIHAGKLKVSEVDENATRVLKLIKYAQASGIPFAQPGRIVDTPRVRELLRRAAGETVVLLKNEASLLPLKKAELKSVAVIGANARDLVYSGGGSAGLATTFKVSPLQALEEEFEGTETKVRWATGDFPYKYTPLMDKYIVPRAGVEGLGNVEFWHPEVDVPGWWDGANVAQKPSWSCGTISMFEFVIDHIPRDLVGNNPKIRLTADFVPDVSSDWELSLISIAGARLYLDGQLIIDNETNYARGNHFVGLGSKEIRAIVPSLVKGRTYIVEVRVWNNPNSSSASAPEIPGGYRVGARPRISDDEALKEAVELAASSDVAVVIVGTNADWESEGADRTSLGLPPSSDRLVQNVLRVNPNTIVITQAGTPLAMPWIGEASTIMHAFLGGNAAGYGISDVLFGNVNPSAKLAVTFPNSLEDNPSAHSFGETSEVPGKVMYDEGIYIGYRHYEKGNIKPLFPFGHGLSYTAFAYRNFGIRPDGLTGSFTISASIQNTGSLPGKESVQFYISKQSVTIDRAVKELCGFAKTEILTPGASQAVSCGISKEAFSFWDCERKCWNAEAGDYQILAGSSSAECMVIGSVTLRDSIYWNGLK